MLLDEITEMDLALASEVTSVCYRKKKWSVSAHAKPIELDVRVIATSNRDLKRSRGQR